MSKLHIALAVKDLDQSINEYSMRLGCSPCCIVPDTYALWRTNTLNFSISVNQEAACALRHLGWEDPCALEMSLEKDINGIVWERFTEDQQKAEIFSNWPNVEYFR